MACHSAISETELIYKLKAKDQELNLQNYIFIGLIMILIKIFLQSCVFKAIYMDYTNHFMGSLISINLNFFYLQSLVHPREKNQEEEAQDSDQHRQSLQGVQGGNWGRLQEQGVPAKVGNKLMNNGPITMMTHHK